MDTIKKILSTLAIAWILVGIIALFNKWTWLVEEGSWLQGIPFLLPFAIIEGIFAVVFVYALIYYIVWHVILGKPFEEEKEDDPT